MIHLLIWENDEGMVNVEKFKDFLEATNRAEALEQYPAIILRRASVEEVSAEYNQIEGEVVYVHNHEGFQTFRPRKTE